MRKLSTVWKINGQAIYTPDVDTKVEIESLVGESSGRTDDGIMHIDWIRTQIRKVYIKYSAMTKEEMAFMLNLVQGKEYTLTYEDPILGVNTINCYTSNSSAELYSAVLHNGLWRNVTFNCIEK
jgi:hypothetical protein